jgi:hypothetical protein
MYMVTSGAHPISSNSGASHSVVDSTPSPPSHGFGGVRLRGH